jgi:hypothetical protein
LEESKPVSMETNEIVYEIKNLMPKKYTANAKMKYSPHTFQAEQINNKWGIFLHYDIDLIRKNDIAHEIFTWKVSSLNKAEEILTTICALKGIGAEQCRKEITEQVDELNLTQRKHLYVGFFYDK